MASGDILQRRTAPQDRTQKLQVIGAGMSRTGTMSFTLALERLLGGQVCHSGSATLLREEAFIKSWIVALKSQSSDAKLKAMLKDSCAGYVGITDTPAILFTGELAELYPDAKVIVTVRDPATWWVSMEGLINSVQLLSLNIAFWPMPTLRYFGAWADANRVRYEFLYSEDGKPPVFGPEHLARHTAYLKRVVPADRLFFFNVKDGWGPLCAILSCPIPDEPFPHANDKAAMQAMFTSFFKEALLVWLQILAVVAAVIGVGIYLWKR